MMNDIVLADYSLIDDDDPDFLDKALHPQDIIAKFLDLVVQRNAFLQMCILEDFSVEYVVDLPSALRRKDQFIRLMYTGHFCIWVHINDVDVLGDFLKLGFYRKYRTTRLMGDWRTISADIKFAERIYRFLLSQKLGENECLVSFSHDAETMLMWS